MRYCIFIVLICLLASCKNQGFLKQKYTSYHHSSQKQNFVYTSQYNKRLVNTQLAIETQKREEEDVKLLQRSMATTTSSKEQVLLHKKVSSKINNKPIQICGEKAKTPSLIKNKLRSNKVSSGEDAYFVTILTCFILLVLLILVTGIILLFSHPLYGIMMISAVILAGIVLLLYSMFM